jgi:uncharacterized membrane protein
MTVSSTPGGPHRQPINRSIMLVLAYLPPFAVIPFLAEKHDPDIHWHAKHGIVLMTAEMLVLLGLVVVSLVLGLLTGGLGCIVVPLILFWALAIPFLGFVTLHVIAVVKALSGKRLIVPILSDYADRF